MRIRLRRVFSPRIAVPFSARCVELPDDLLPFDRLGERIAKGTRTASDVKNLVAARSQRDRRPTVAPETVELYGVVVKLVVLFLRTGFDLNPDSMGVAPPGPQHDFQINLSAGDEPGHSPGHVSYWRESDRVLVSGDVIWGTNPFINAGPPREPFPFLSPDPQRNRESARRLAALEPALVCFGHGAPLRDTARFAEVVSKLPR